MSDWTRWPYLSRRMEVMVLVWLICGVLGAVLAQSKNRSPLTGGLVGVLGGPIGVFVLACLRTLGPGETERNGLGTPVKVLVVATAALVAVVVVVAVLVPSDDVPAKAAAPPPAAAIEAIAITVRMSHVL